MSSEETRKHASIPGPKRPRKARSGEAGLPWWRRKWAIALAAALVLAGVFAGVVAARGPFFFMSCDPDDLGPTRLDRTSYVYAADGRVLATLDTAQDHRPVELAAVSPNLRKATIAIEDRRFYEHEGIDYFAVVRAVFRDVAAGGVVEGGSTITQQLARNLYLTHERTLGRKLAEGCLAVALEREWSKDRILQEYLNTAYYGNGAYGAEAASRTYFSRSARELTLEQAALLAGLPMAPSQLDPFSSEDGARARRDQVLRALVETGEVAEGPAARARNEPLGLRPGAAGRRQDRSIVNLVLGELNERYGSAAIRSGGLKVYTTIQRPSQRLARSAIRSSLDRRRDPAAAVVAIDPASGAIRAATSVAPRAAQFFDLVAHGRRQPGSAFKTLVLIESVRRGINPWSTTYLSAPFEGPPSRDKPWNVETYDRTYTGRIRIADATLRSDNTVFARLTMDVGPERIVEVARSLGIEEGVEPVPSIGLGTASVSPLELASAYATLAAGGVRAEPFLIRKVAFPDGREDGQGVWGPKRKERVLSEAVAFQVTRILEANVEAGTGTQAQIGRPAAGKTGTTDDYADAWFAGYTPQLATVVWVGYPRGRVPMTDVHGIAVTGGSFPAAIWGAFMSRALEGAEAAGWTEPGGVEWKRWCGRFQYAPTYRDAKPENGCPKRTTSSQQTTTQQTQPGTTAPPAPPPQQPPPQQPPPQQPPPTTPFDEAIGKKGRVTQDIDNNAQTGEVEIGRELWPARSETGQPIPLDTRIEVVRTDGTFLFVVPR